MRVRERERGREREGGRENRVPEAHSALCCANLHRVREGERVRERGRGREREGEREGERERDAGTHTQSHQDHSKCVWRHDIMQQLPKRYLYTKP